jgi:hypothetical protein
VAGGADQPGRSDVAVQVLPADRDQVLDRDGVVQVGEPVDPWQADVDAAQQRLDAASGLARLDAEPEEGVPPGGDLRESLGWTACQSGTGGVLGVAQGGIAGVVAGPAAYPGRDEENGAVVRAQREDRRSDLGAGQRGGQCSICGAVYDGSLPTAGSNTVRANRAGRLVEVLR